jgi:hypothetical protein
MAKWQYDPLTAVPEVKLSAEDSHLADGGRFPSSSEVSFRWLDVPGSPRVVIELAVVEQQPVVTSFSLRSRDPGAGVAVDLTQVRSMPLTTFRDLAIRYTTGYSAERESERAAAEGRRLTHDEWDRQWRSGQVALNTARRRREITDDLLQRVAQTYNSDTSGRPTEAVASAEIMSHRNAGRLIALARERGFIPPVSRRSSVSRQQKSRKA